MGNRISNKETIFWKVALISLGILGLSSGILHICEFWTSYILDITGPAWCYLLIRGRYKSNNATFLSIRFSPESALFLIIGICFIIETAQFLELYDSSFDPYDYLAYFSGTVAVYFIDKLTI